MCNLTYSALLGPSDLHERVRTIAKMLFSNGNQHLYQRLEIALLIGDDSDLNKLLSPIFINHITGRVHSGLSALNALGFSQELHSLYPDEEIEAALVEWAKSKRPKPVEIKPLPPMNAPALMVRGDAITETPPISEQPKSLKSLASTSKRFETPTNSPKKRRDLLDPVIAKAKRECETPDDYLAVWPILQVMANQKVAPLIGVSEEGIKWVDDCDEVHTFKKQSLRERFRRDRQRLQEHARTR